MLESKHSIHREIDSKLLEILVCPVTKSTLSYDHERQELVSEKANLAFPIRDGIPIMLASEARLATHDANIWPFEIKLKKSESLLEISFEDGATFSLPAEYLRVESPSAEVRGRSIEWKTTILTKRKISIKDLDPVGHYAVRIIFSDGHNSGLFTWKKLYRLGLDKEKIWSKYLSILEAQDLQ